MIGQTVTCARPECDNNFDKRTHNQKYCSNICCNIETNIKIKEKYHRRVAIKRGQKRECIRCSNLLSRYNETDTCSSCQSVKRRSNANSAAQLVAAISWS